MSSKLVSSKSPLTIFFALILFVGLGTTPAKASLTQETAPLIPTEVSEQTRIDFQKSVEANRSNTFAKVGDSNTEQAQNIYGIGCYQFKLYEHENLRKTVDLYKHTVLPGADRSLCAPTNSFSRRSAATRGGSWSSFPLSKNRTLPTEGGWFLRDPLCVDDQQTVLECELELTNARYTFIAGGTNDLNWGFPAETAKQRFLDLIAVARSNNTIPVLQTIPPVGPHYTKPEGVASMNAAILQAGQEAGVPVINVWRALEILPNRGTTSDGVHLSYPPGANTTQQGALFSPQELQYGANTRNLLFLQTLHFLDTELGVYSGAVDIDPPKTFIEIPGHSSLQNKTSYTATFSSNEENVTYECRFWHGFSVTDFKPCSENKTFTADRDGLWTLQARAVDAVGNVDAATAVKQWTVDTTPPEVTIISGPKNNSLTNQRNISFKSQSNEPTVLGGIYYILKRNGVVYEQNFSAPEKSFHNLPDGDYSYTPNWVDRAGNHDPDPPTINWTIDTTPPKVNIISGQEGGAVTSSRTASFTSHSDKPSVIGGIVYTLRHNGMLVEQGFSGRTKSFSNLETGRYTYTVNWIDRAGNWDPNPPSRTWTVSDSNPRVTINSGPANNSFTNSREAHFKSSSDKTTIVGGIIYTLTRNGRQVEHNFSGANKSFYNLPDGDYSFTINWVDEAGKWDPEPPTVNWTIDTKPPVTTILSGPAEGSVTSDNNPTFVSESNEPSVLGGVVYSLKRNGEIVEQGFTGASKTFTDLPPGEYEYMTYWIDRAGNHPSNPPTVTWTITPLE